MQTSLPGHIIHITCWYFQTQYSLFRIQGKTKSSSITCLIVCRKHSGLRTVERMPSVQGQHAGCSYAVFAHTPPFFLHLMMKSHWRSTDGIIIWQVNDADNVMLLLLEQNECSLSLISIHKLRSLLWLIYFYQYWLFYISVAQYLLLESIY